MHLHFFCEFRTPYLIIYIAPSIHLESKRQVSEDVDETQLMKQMHLDFFCEFQTPYVNLMAPNLDEIFSFHRKPSAN